MAELKPGDSLYGFTLEAVSDQKEYGGKGYTFRHNETGLELFHLHNSDTENLFSFIFKTPASDNTGAAHILEHSVLSGSRRYPVKDPFMALMKGSMNTFLNAMTYPEKTVYPAASPVEKDYFNMMSVYGDAVFFPLLKKEVFHQEGHRMEFDDEGKLRITGVVFNEMKGAYSNHDSIAGEWSYRSLFPDTQYYYDSGGEPSAIPDLSYREFVEFHEKYYHPSNCRIFLYGNIETGKQLEFLQDNFLKEFAGMKPAVELQKQPRWSSPGSAEFTSPLLDDEDPAGKTTITVNWLTGEMDSPLELLSLEVLSEILLSNPGAPIYRAVVDSGLGDDLSPVSGLETDLAETVFSAGIRGTNPDKKEAFEKLLEDELSLLAEKGIPGDISAGALKRVEFRMREIKGGAPFGLRLMGRALRGWLHGQSPESTLEFTKWIEELKHLYNEDNRYFEKLIDKVLLRNPHRMTVTVRPDRNHVPDQENQLEQRADVLMKNLTPEQKQEIMEDSRKLTVFQDTPDSPEDSRKIPCLSLEDIPEDIAVIDTSVSECGGVPFYSHDLFTNGINYMDFGFDLGGLTEEDHLFLPVLSRMMTSGSLPGIPYDEVARLLMLNTGGFSSFLEAGNILPDRGSMAEYIFFRLKFLEDDLYSAIDLAVRMLLETDLKEEKRLKDVVSEMRNSFASSVVPSGHSYASLRAGSRLSHVYAREENWRGVEQLLFLNKLNSEISAEGASRLGTRLDQLRGKIVSSASMSINAAAGSSELERMMEYFGKKLEEFPVSEIRNQTDYVYAEKPSTTEGLIVPAPVSYVAQYFKGSVIESREHGAEIILSSILKTDYLWETVRMKGGAYGAFASANGMEGLFGFSSYRDPNIEKTLDAYRNGLKLMSESEIPVEIIEKAVISTVGSDLRPMSPGEKSIIGFRRKLYNITDDLRRNRRNAVIETSPGDLRQAAARLLAAMEQSSVVVLGGKEAVSRASAAVKELGENSITLPV